MRRCITRAAKDGYDCKTRLLADRSLTLNEVVKSEGMTILRHAAVGPPAAADTPKPAEIRQRVQVATEILLARYSRVRLKAVDRPLT